LINFPTIFSFKLFNNKLDMAVYLIARKISKQLDKNKYKKISIKTIKQLSRQLSLFRWNSAKKIMQPNL
jgi:hypothetical protein